MAAYEDLGRKLRDARLERRLELRDIAQSLHIRPLYLEALEEGTLEQLPGDVFVHGYLSRYARYLGLEPDELLKEYRSIGALPQGHLRYIPDSMREQHHPGWHVVAVTIGMAVILVLSWGVGRMRDEVVQKQTPQATHAEAKPVAPPPASPKASPCNSQALWPPCYWVPAKSLHGVMHPK